MDEFVKGATTILLAQGLGGVIMVALAVAFYRVCKLYISAQERRIEEAQATTSALVSSSAVLNRVADILQHGKN